uniref:aspartate kinase n=1 Tax=Flavobacterium sp. TaxID=239 RepID=UPI00404B8E46
MNTNNHIHLFIFGVGNVGSTLIKQITERFQNTQNSKTKLSIVFIANSRKAIFNPNGLNSESVAILQAQGVSYTKETVVHFVNQHGFSNIILVDATASESFVHDYSFYVQAGFHLVAANKKANTLPFPSYLNLRKLLAENNKYFLYETNVGAGLPVIQTIADLKQTHEKVLKIRGVFSGSLSYIFNCFGSENSPFSDILNQAEQLGFTEPDAREDLSGQDVARKLLILARELGFAFNFSDVKITSLLIPELTSDLPHLEFQKLKNLLDKPFETAKKAQSDKHVLRYVGEFDVLAQTLTAKLISVPVSTPLGQLKSSSNFIEITTDSYAENPIIIQGPGAGKSVTALGVLLDIIKISNLIYKENNAFSNALAIS